MRTVFFWFSLLWAILLLLPAGLVAGSHTEPAAELRAASEVTTGQTGETAPMSDTESPPQETASDTDTDTPDKKQTASPYHIPLVTDAGSTDIDLEAYVTRVLWAELPASFTAEAWRATAVAVRTYAVYCAERGISITDDSAVSCAYLTEADARTRFGDGFDAVLGKAEDAVSATAGEILLWDGEAACTVFHAMSLGMTASAESVWGNAYPYLVSVSTPEDETLNGCVTTAQMDAGVLCERLGVPVSLPLTITEDVCGRAGIVTTADGRSFSGTQFRNLLSLRSTDIAVAKQDTDSVTLTVSGYGHGVGMSQWGAELMARQDVGYREILAHYYPGTEIGEIP
ncbi:MAG: SpoIID/LytB domain-containing protein [Clostridia bacterium]|nr:SpoIID/LytB domain-containing protein [Clostridia bacterium]